MPQFFSFGPSEFLLIAWHGRKQAGEFDGEIGAELAFQIQLACIVEIRGGLESRWAAKISGGSVMEYLLRRNQTVRLDWVCGSLWGPLINARKIFLGDHDRTSRGKTPMPFTGEENIVGLGKSVENRA